MRLRASLTLMILAGFSAAAPVPKEAKRDDAGRILGEWEAVRAEFNGRDYNKDVLTFSADSINWKTSRNAGDSIWKYTLDPAKNPKEFEMVYNGNVKYFGFYKFEGDTLILCCKHNAQPTGFNSDHNTFFYEFRRSEGK